MLRQRILPPLRAAELIIVVTNHSICEQMQLQSIPCVFVDLPISRSVRAVGSSQKHL
jgi:hypothetical protein